MPECAKCKSRATGNDGHIIHVKGCEFEDIAEFSEDLKACYLQSIILGMKQTEASVKTKRVGRHFEFLVGIGKDHTAYITLDEEAYNALMMEKY